jgi:hypothetical protein
MAIAESEILRIINSLPPERRNEVAKYFKMLIKKRRAVGSATRLPPLLPLSVKCGIGFRLMDRLSATTTFTELPKDKGHNYTDCVSMIVCRERDVGSVLTPDIHFAQEGFTKLMNLDFNLD